MATLGSAVPITEAEWQEQVIQLARLLGWKWLHVRRSIGRGKRWTTATNVIGFPDLFLWHPTRGFVALELKVGSLRGWVGDRERRAPRRRRRAERAEPPRQASRLRLDHPL